MTSEFHAARILLARDLRTGRINKRQYSARLRAANKAEARALYKVAKEAVKRLEDYCERLDREKVRDDMRRNLSLALRRYEASYE